MQELASVQLFAPLGAVLASNGKAERNAEDQENGNQGTPKGQALFGNGLGLGLAAALNVKLVLPFLRIDPKNEVVLRIPQSTREMRDVEDHLDGPRHPRQRDGRPLRLATGYVKVQQ